MLKTVLFAVVLGALAYFALTRTQVGRDGLRNQIERQFNERFQGRLAIGQLTGNLINDLFASDVRFFAPSGELVLQVDSVIARPRWRAFFRRHISVGDLTLIRPEGHLLYQADSTWNLTRAFRRRTPDSTRAPWAFTSTEIEIVDGRLTTNHEDVLPSPVVEGWLFNYAKLAAQDIQVRAAFEWQSSSKVIDVLKSSADLSDQTVDLDQLQGQFILEDSSWVLNRFNLQLGQTHLALSATVGDWPDVSAAPTADTFLDVDLTPSRIHFDELRTFFPRWPLRDAVTLSTRLRGPLSGLVLETAQLERGDTRLQAEGTLLGFPDSLDVEVALHNSSARPRDLRAVWPEAPVDRLAALGPVALQLQVSGVSQSISDDFLSDVQAEAQFDVQGNVGALRGTVALARSAGDPFQYNADLRADSLDLRRLTNRPAWASLLNGDLQLHGRSLTPDSAVATLQASFHRSMLADRRIDTLHVETDVDRRRVDGTVLLGQAGGVLLGRTTLDFNPSHPTHFVDVVTRGLDLGALLRSDSLTTDLNTHLRLAGTGTSWSTLNTELAVAFDSSSIQRKQVRRTVVPHRSTLTVAPRGDAGPRLALTGDLATLRLDGDVELQPLIALARLWSRSYADAIRRQRAKPYRAASIALPPPDVAVPLFRERARAALQQAGLDTLSLHAEFDLKRSDLLTALIPHLPPLASDLSAEGRLTSNADKLRLDGTLQGDSLHTSGLRASSFAVDLALASTLDAPPEETTTLWLNAEADSFFVGDQSFVQLGLVARYEQLQGRIRCTADANRGADPLRLAATLRLLDDRNRLTLTDLQLAAGDYHWSNPQTATIDLYQRAVVVSNLVLESQSPATARRQRIRLHGALSSAPSDTLFAEASDIGLRQLSAFWSMNRPLGGWLNSQLALTGTTQPELTGTVDVTAFSFDNRLLGRLEASSRYVPGLPDVRLDVALQPDPQDSSRTTLPGTTIPAQFEEQNLHLGGTFRLPQFDAEGNQVAPGTLDLQLAAERLDAFFFEYIFDEILSNVEGAFQGQGTIRGSFRHPIFEADLHLTDGAFDVPRFNLHYQIDGPITVDEEGIKPRNMTLRDPTGGTATINGAFLFNDYEYFSFDLVAQLQEMQIINVEDADARDLPFYGEIRASGEATLTGPLYNAFLRSTNATTTPDSEVFIPIEETEAVVDPGFIIYTDSTGQLPDLQRFSRRENILADRPAGERPFLDGLEMELALDAPQGSTVHLVIDPLLGDVINAVGSGNIQLERHEGEFSTFGTLEVTSGDYLFTASDVFVRRFIIQQGTITWDGDPIDAQLDLQADYRTRASSAGLPPEISRSLQSLIPVVIQLHITGRVSSPLVDLQLALEQRDQGFVGGAQLLEPYLNQPERSTEYATSVLLTNSFLLTTQNTESSNALAASAFNSVSQLVASQLNRYLNEAIPNVDFTFGVQGNETAQDLDVTYGLALRLLDERLIIRGQGVYRANDSSNADVQEGLQGEFVVEVRLSPSVSVEVFFRREGDVLNESILTSTTGAGLSYQTQFRTWRRLFKRIFRRSEKKESQDVTTDQ